jgi:hypothetical protein
MLLNNGEVPIGLPANSWNGTSRRRNPKQKPRQSGVCVIAADMCQAAAASLNFFLRPTQPNRPSPTAIIA